MRVCYLLAQMLGNSRYRQSSRKINQLRYNFATSCFVVQRIGIAAVQLVWNYFSLLRPRIRRSTLRPSKWGPFEIRAPLNDSSLLLDMGLPPSLQHSSFGVIKSRDSLVITLPLFQVVLTYRFLPSLVRNAFAPRGQTCRQ